MKTDSPPDTKSEEQSDEDVLRQESFKKGKKKVIGERRTKHIDCNYVLRKKSRKWIYQVPYSKVFLTGKCRVS